MLNHLAYKARYGLEQCGWIVAQGVKRLGEGSLSAFSDEERLLNSRLSGYPPNHNYRVRRREMLLSFKLHKRVPFFEKLYPQPLVSMLDIGCCRGCYVLRAAAMPQCRLAVGVDVHEPFIAICRDAQKYMGASNARFYVSTLDKMAEDPAAFGGPFQTILLVGTYHYMYWGSKLSDNCHPNHRDILSLLATLCTDRVVLSARLELDELPDFVKPTAASSPAAASYNTRDFIKAAQEFFDVRPAGNLDEYPVYVLVRKGTQP